MVKIIENYTLKEQIGSGSYATVYKATHKNKEGLFAIKMIPIETFQQIQKLQECVNNEIKVLNMIGKSPHIVTYHQKLKSKANYYFVYDYCNGGTLESYLRKQQQLSEKQSLGIFAQLISAFRILNKYNIMHRDLKPENILFHDGKIKLGDFGFCKDLQSDDSLAKTMLGSPIYMAPEILKGHMYTTKADIWSMGVILYEMVYGQSPYNSKNIFDLIQNIETTEIKFPDTPYVSERTKNLIRKMLMRDSFRRINWIQLFKEEISQVGQYIQNRIDNTQSKSLKETRSPIINKKEIEYLPSDFQLKNSLNQRKPSSLPKQENKKIFYSQNFIDLLSSKNIPLGGMKEEQQTTKHLSYITPKHNKEKEQKEQSLRIIDNQVGVIKTQKSREIETTNQLINLHEKVAKKIKRTLSDLESNGKDYIPEAYFEMKRVQTDLKTITEMIKSTRYNLFDLKNVVIYEGIQLDTILMELKSHMDGDPITPQSDEIYKNFDRGMIWSLN